MYEVVTLLLFCNYLVPLILVDMSRWRSRLLHGSEGGGPPLGRAVGRRGRQLRQRSRRWRRVPGVPGMPRRRRRAAAAPLADDNQGQRVRLIVRGVRRRPRRVRHQRGRRVGLRRLLAEVVRHLG